MSFRNNYALVQVHIEKIFFAKYLQDKLVKKIFSKKAPIFRGFLAL